MNKYNTSKILEAIADGDIYMSIQLLKDIPNNHVRYAYLYHSIVHNMYLSQQNIGPLNDYIVREFNELKFPYVFTYRHLRKLKGGVINE